ncbi:MAG TPA: hypothetical protein PLC40_12830, partial [Candidatus Hydrogenedentes bacterium]|nr:hypothetical protein [Candidatus Hydrogenedentota bacterium]
GERRSLLEDACAKLQEAARWEDALNWTWGVWGNAFRELADVQDSEEERRRCLEQALEKAEHAFSRNLKQAAYNCACYAALLGKVDECRQWLARAEAERSLPPLEHMQTDKDLDGVRETVWFRDLVARRQYKEDVS